MEKQIKNISGRSVFPIITVFSVLFKCQKFNYIWISF